MVQGSGELWNIVPPSLQINPFSNSRLIDPLRQLLVFPIHSVTAKHEIHIRPVLMELRSTIKVMIVLLWMKATRQTDNRSIIGNLQFLSDRLARR